MPKIKKLTVTWSGLVPTFAKHLREWTPPKLPTEANYRDNLLNFLRESVPNDAKVEKEFRHHGTTLDLWVGWKGVVSIDELAFELKVDLKKKAQYDRLVGQIEGVNPSKNKLLLVLIGDTDPALLGRLRERYARHIDSPVEITMAIVEVKPQ